MLPRIAHSLLALPIVLAILLQPWVARSSEEPASVPEAARTEQAATREPAAPPDAPEALREQQSCSRRDPTGVRARLGMCRRGETDGQSCRHRRFHGGGHRWTTPPP